MIPRSWPTSSSATWRGLAQLESLITVKPVARIADVPLAVVDIFRYMAGGAPKIEGNTIPIPVPGSYLAYTAREPVGVVGRIPWNFPLPMAAEGWRRRWRRAAPWC